MGAGSQSRARTPRFLTAAKPLVLVVACALLPALGSVPPWSDRAVAESAPPWERDTSPIGSLRFYNSQGELITRGSVDKSPFAAFVQASVDGRSGDDSASLHVFTPRDDAPASAWTGARLSGPTDYPNAGAPTRVNGTVLPVVSGRAGDRSLASYIANEPGVVTSGTYNGVYQLRLHTARSEDEATRYSATYIRVADGAWTQIHPAIDSTTVALGVTPPSWAPGNMSVSLVAKLTPATVGGTVTFQDGATQIASIPHRAIQAFLEGIELSPGRHLLSATFRPHTDPFQSSSSSIEYHQGVAAAQATTTTLTVNPPGPVVEGTTVTLTARVDPTAAPGSVDFFDGPHVMATVPLDQGAAAYASTTLKPSEHHLSATYRSSSPAYRGSTSERVRLKVTKRKDAVPQDQQVITVKVPSTKVLGTKTKRKGILGLTGAPLIALMIVGAAGVATGAIVLAGTHRRRS